MVNKITPQQFQELKNFEPFNKKVKGKEELTQEAAIKILKNIERTSKVKAFFTNPKVVLVLGTLTGLLVGAGVGAALFYGLGLPLTAIVALKIAKLVLTMGLLSTLTTYMTLGKFERISADYSHQARQANQLLKMLDINNDKN